MRKTIILSDIRSKTQHIRLLVPDVEVGYCLGSEQNGVSSGNGGEGGPSPLGDKIDKQVLSKGRDNMVKDEEDQTSQT